MAASRRRPAAQETMLGLITGYWVSQLVYVVAELGVADVLAAGPRTAESIARRVGAHPPSLRRVLRALASVGVFAEDGRGRFRLTPLAQTLRSDRPGSLRDFARMMVDDWNWQSWGALQHGIRTGESPFLKAHGVPTFEFLRRHPDKESVFSASMASISASENHAVARAYPFGDLDRLVDVGGAHGHLLATILRRHRRLRGVLYDQPQVVAGAEQRGFLSERAIGDRVEVRGGDFFSAVPTGADAYLMKYILHDWDDDLCLRILGHCREAMAPGGRVLVVEHVIPPGNAANWGKLLDINMMAGPGGRERTRSEFEDLFRRAGLRLARIVPTACPLSILDAVPR